MEEYTERGIHDAVAHQDRKPMAAHSWAAIENTGHVQPILEEGRPSLWFVLEYNHTKQPVLEKNRDLNSSNSPSSESIPRPASPRSIRTITSHSMDYSFS